MHRLVFRVEVRSDLRDAFEWYERRRPGLGREFILEVERALFAACERPLAARRVAADVRRVLLRRFPYKAYYLVENDAVVVLLISHSSRRPGGWKRRL
ncbi:Plasmid stabilization system protein [Phycisphaerae bacterium RAS1]|nr:Plasmid stabilization system protein [Phycisphaerae bacterium RAS1]